MLEMLIAKNNADLRPGLQQSCDEVGVLDASG